MKTKKLKWKPCPLCGNTKLEIGCISGTNYGVRCMDLLSPELKGCRLILVRDFCGGEFECKRPKPYTWKKHQKMLINYTMLLVNKLWNNRIGE